MSERDPRAIITPDAFKVAPDLLGLPLATPWRRGVAMAVDGILVAILSSAPGAFFGFAAAGFLIGVSAPAPGTGFLRRSFRMLLRVAAAIVLFVSATATWAALSDPPEAEAPDGVVTSGDIRLSGLDGVRAAVDIARAETADSDEEALEAARRLVDRLDPAARERMREEIADVTERESDPRTLRALRTALGPPTAPADSGAVASGPNVDSLARAYVAALTGSDTAARARLGPRLGVALAGDTIAELNSELDALDEERDDIAAALAREREDDGGILAFLRSLAEAVGLEFGWAALYFTIFPPLWGGRTPGKRMLGIRIVRLTGKPIGYWFAFERFGGYAAGLVTGLLGFAQMFWDANRQGVHDKIAETVVVRERRRRADAPDRSS